MTLTSEMRRKRTCCLRLHLGRMDFRTHSRKADTSDSALVSKEVDVMSSLWIQSSWPRNFLKKIVVNLGTSHDRYLIDFQKEYK
ncbi:hypothetical protein AD936_22260 [Gluconobacter japonicus]|nr:hypothetical protein AD936_22260 [Gluconobacter japonicus]